MKNREHKIKLRLATCETGLGGAGQMYLHLSLKYIGITP